MATFRIDAGARLEGQVRAGVVVVGGELQGNIDAAKQVDVLTTGVIVGDVKAASITVAAGSRMRGHVEFGWEEQARCGGAEGHSALGMSTLRSGAPGATRVCPHCKATVLESAAVCPGCRHHLRFGGAGQVLDAGEGYCALSVDGTIAHTQASEPCEYCVVLDVKDDRGEQLTRQVVGVGVLQVGELRRLNVSVEMLPVRAPVAVKPQTPKAACAHCGTGGRGSGEATAAAIPLARSNQPSRSSRLPTQRRCGDSGSSASAERPPTGAALPAGCAPDSPARCSLHCQSASWPSVLRLAELEQKLVAAALQSKHLGIVRIVGVVQHVAAAFELETNARDLLLHQLRIDPVQRIGVTRARAGSGHMILDDEYPTGLERIENAPCRKPSCRACRTWRCADRDSSRWSTPHPGRPAA